MALSSRRITRHFDKDAAYFHGRDTNMEGRDVHTGDPVATNYPLGVRMRLWLMGHIHTADEMTKFLRTEFGYDPVVVAKEGGPWWSVNAPWLDAPIKAMGEKKANERAAEIREAGEPDYHHRVAVLGDGEGGWYQVKPDWLDSQENVQGRAAALARANALRREGPPADWDGVTIDLAPEPVAIVRSPGDLITFDPKERGARIDAVDGDQVAISYFDDDGVMQSAVVPLSDLSDASDEDAEDFLAALAESGNE